MRKTNNNKSSYLSAKNTGDPNSNIFELKDSIEGDLQKWYLTKASDKYNLYIIQSGVEC